MREDLIYLSYILGYNELCRLSTDYHSVGLYNRRSNPFTLTEMPRGTFKTTFFTVIESIQDALIDPNIRILICHFAGQNARDMLDEIQNHFITNTYLRFAFVDICPQNTKRPETGNWQSDSVTIQRPYHYREGTFEALGSDQAMASKHYDKIKFDDLVIEQSTTTIDQIKKASAFLTKSYSLLNNHNPKRSLSIVGTEWVPDDTMVQVKQGKILAPDGNPFKVFRIPAEMEDKVTKERIPLFPEILSMEVLNGLRKSQRTTYHAFYLMDAEEFEDQVWKKKDISYYTQLPHDREYKIFGAVDPSITESDIKNNCQTAIAIMAKDSQNEVWLLDYVLGHGVDIIYSAFFDLHTKWKDAKLTYRQKNKDEIDELRSKPLGKFRFFSVEITLFQKLIAKDLRVKMSEKNHWVPIRESRPVKEKSSRIMGALDGLLQNQAFHIRPEHDEAETQILRFGRPGQRVDLLDAVAQGILEADAVVKSEKRKNIEKEFDDMWKEAYIV